MELTIKLDQRKKEAKALVDYLHNLPFVEVAAKHNISKEEELYAMITAGVKEARQIAHGKRKGKPLQELIDEL